MPFDIIKEYGTAMASEWHRLTYSALLPNPLGGKLAELRDATPKSRGVTIQYACETGCVHRQSLVCARNLQPDDCVGITELHILRNMRHTYTPL